MSIARIAITVLQSALALSGAAPAFAADSGGAAGVAAFGGSAMRPGLWEVSNTTTFLAPGRQRTVTTRSCLTASDLNEPRRIVPEQHQPGMRCQARDVKASAGSIVWKISCKGAKGSIDGTASITPAAESYEGTASLDMKSGPESGKIAQALKATRIGVCT